MHRRCCWPPDSASPDCLSLSLTSSHSAARRRLVLDELVHVALHAVDPRPERDVVVDRLGERVGLLEHHADPATDLDRVDVLRRTGRRRGTGRSPSTRVPGIRSFIRLIVRSSVDLPQPDGPMSAVICLRRERDRHVLHRAERAVVEATRPRARMTARAPARPCPRRRPRSPRPAARRRRDDRDGACVIVDGSGRRRSSRRASASSVMPSVEASASVVAGVVGRRGGLGHGGLPRVGHHQVRS